MRRRGLLLLAAVLLGASAPVARAAPPSPSPEVVVDAPRGPAVWRAVLGGGELDLLPTPLAAPTGLDWNSRRLELLLAGARVLLTPAAYALDQETTRPRPGASPPPELDARLPASVRDRLERELARLGASPQAYARLTPLEAAYRLRTDALRAADLDPAEPDAAVKRLARRAGTPLRPVATYRADLGVDQSLLPDAQAALCLDGALDDVEQARAHGDAARAWALGDVRAWLAQSRPPRTAVCLDAAPAFAALSRRTLDDTAAAARAALARGGRTVVLTSPDLLLRPGGLLDRLRAAGAVVTPPPGADG